MKKAKNYKLQCALSVVLSVILSLMMMIPAFAIVPPDVLLLGENPVALGEANVRKDYTFTPEETKAYVIRSVSESPSDPYMDFNFTTYDDYNGTKDFYCVATLTAGTAYTFEVKDKTENSSFTIVVEEKPATAPTPLSLGANENLDIPKFNYKNDYPFSFTPPESGIYEFVSDGYGDADCDWDGVTVGGDIGIVNDLYSNDFRFEKTLTSGVTYKFLLYDNFGWGNGTVTITKKTAATVELDALSLSFGAAPAVLNTIGSASVELPADPHCTAEWTWEDQYGNELVEGAVFRCGSYFLSATITPDSGYQFADNVDVTFAALDAAADHEIVVSGLTVSVNARFVFGGENGHSYAGWEEMSNIQVAEAGLGEPYAGCVWEQNFCTVCEYTKYRGGDSAEICVIDLSFSGAPAADLTADDVTVAVPEDRPYYLVPTTDGADPSYPGWIGTLGDGASFLCRSEYTGFCVLMPTAGHYFTRDGDLEINVEVTPADAVIGTDYAFISGSEAVYVSADFAETDHIYQGPVWSWAEDYSEAYAVFTCAYGDWTVTATAHNPPVTVVSEATYTVDKLIYYTATVTFRDETYTNTTDTITVAGTAAALLAADTSTFNACKEQRADAMDDLAAEGDSEACAALIAEAKAAVNALYFDPWRTLDDNMTVVTQVADAITAALTADLMAQRAEEAAAAQLAADKAAFEDYKTAKAAELDALAAEDDSAASNKLIADAKAAVAGIAYDESKTLEENKAAADASAQTVAEQLTADLAAQRAADQAAAEDKPDEPQDEPQKEDSGFRSFLNRIRDFFRKIIEFFKNLFKR